MKPEMEHFIKRVDLLSTPGTDAPVGQALAGNQDDCFGIGGEWVYELSCNKPQDQCPQLVSTAY